MDIQFRLRHNCASRKGVKTKDNTSKRADEREAKVGRGAKTDVRIVKAVERKNDARVQLIGAGRRDANRRRPRVQEKAAGTNVKIKPIASD